MRSRWATTSSSATATACARRCSGLRDRNGGFSQADFAQLYAPPLMDPVYGFQAVNVEAAAADVQLAAALAAPLHRACARSIRCSARHLQADPHRTTPDLRLDQAVRGRPRPVRSQPRALGAGGRARPRAVPGPLPGGVVRSLAFPPDRRAALPADARAARLLLVRARRGRE